MKDRSNLALALAVLAIVIIVAGILVGGLVGRTKYLRLNNVVWKNYINLRNQSLFLHLNRLEIAVLNVRLIRASGQAPKPEDVQALVGEIEGIQIQTAEDSPLIEQLAQWKREMLIQLQVPLAGGAGEAPAPTPDDGAALPAPAP